MRLAWQWAKTAHVTSTSQGLVLRILAEHARNCGHAWPGLNRILEQVSIKRRRVQYVLRSLEASGLITIEARHDGNGRTQSNLYRLHIPDPWPCDRQCPKYGIGRPSITGADEGPGAPPGAADSAPPGVTQSAPPYEYEEEYKKESATNVASTRTRARKEPPSKKTEPSTPTPPDRPVSENGEMLRGSPETVAPTPKPLLTPWWDEDDRYAWLRVLLADLRPVERAPPSQSWADEIGEDFGHVDLVGEAKRFRDYWTGSGRKLKNWRLAWRNWLGKAPAMQKDTRHRPFAARCVCPMCEQERSGVDLASEYWDG